MIAKDSAISTLAQKVDHPACYSNAGTFLCLYHHSAETFLGKGGSSGRKCKRAVEGVRKVERKNLDPLQVYRTDRKGVNPTQFGKAWE